MLDYIQILKELYTLNMCRVFVIYINNHNIFYSKLIVDYRTTDCNYYEWVPQNFFQHMVLRVGVVAQQDIRMYKAFGKSLCIVKVWSIDQNQHAQKKCRAYRCVYKIILYIWTYYLLYDERYAMVCIFWYTVDDSLSLSLSLLLFF